MTDNYKQMCIEIMQGAHNQEDDTEQFVSEVKREAYKEMVSDGDSLLFQVVTLNCHG